MKETGLREKQRGVALLAVLWLTAALSAMALATSYMVRTEVEAATNRIEAQQGYFLARGGIEAAVDTIARSTFLTPGAGSEADTRPEFVAGQRWISYEFPGGRCAVEVVPENGKLNANLAPSEQLAALFRTLGVGAAESAELALAIVDWRSPRTSEVGSVFDAYYDTLSEPYQARHAPLGQLEELLPVKGMSRELFFGRLEETRTGRWRRRPPLADLLTVAPTAGAVNLNSAPLEVLQSLPGWDAAAAATVIGARERTPFESLSELDAIAPSGGLAGGGANLTIALEPFYTLTATCVPADATARRSVRALLEITPNQPLYHQVVAWWDNWPYANEPPQTLANRGAGGRAGVTETERENRGRT